MEKTQYLNEKLACKIQGIRCQEERKDHLVWRSWHIAVMPALGRLRQENHYEAESYLTQIAELSLGLHAETPCLEREVKQKMTKRMVTTVRDISEWEEALQHIPLQRDARGSSPPLSMLWRGEELSECRSGPPG